MFRHLVRLKTDTEGVTALEYGLIGAFIFLVIVAGLQLTGTNLLAKLNLIATSLQ